MPNLKEYFSKEAKEYRRLHPDELRKFVLKGFYGWVCAGIVLIAGITYAVTSNIFHPVAPSPKPKPKPIPREMTVLPQYGQDFFQYLRFSRSFPIVFRVAPKEAVAKFQAILKSTKGNANIHVRSYKQLPNDETDYGLVEIEFDSKPDIGAYSFEFRSSWDDELGKPIPSDPIGPRDVTFLDQFSLSTLQTYTKNSTVIDDKKDLEFQEIQEGTLLRIPRSDRVGKTVRYSSLLKISTGTAFKFGDLLQDLWVSIDIDKQTLVVTQSDKTIKPSVSNPFSLTLIGEGQPVAFFVEQTIQELVVGYRKGKTDSILYRASIRNFAKKFFKDPCFEVSRGTLLFAGVLTTGEPTFPKKKSKNAR